MQELLGASGGYAAMFAVLWVGFEGLNMLLIKIKSSMEKHK